MVFGEGDTPWNKGLTKGVSQKVADYGQKVGKSLKGRKLSVEHCKKIGLAKNFKGHKHSEATRKKLSEMQKGILHPNSQGEKSPHWRGGKSFEPYSVDWTITLKRAIRERDNYICQLCSQYGNVVHHINYNKRDCTFTNLINLCRRCNSKVNFNREKWVSYFKLKEG